MKSAVYWFIRKRRESGRDRTLQNVEAISIADMAFLLLIFFIVTGSFILRQGVFFSLPSGTAGAVKVDSKELVDLYPLNEGFRLQGTAVSREVVYSALTDLKKENPDIIMVIRIAPEIRYERLVDALSLAKETGIKRVSLKDIDD
jgi:biopolymer transport protein ExbD